MLLLIFPFFHLPLFLIHFPLTSFFSTPTPLLIFPLSNIQSGSDPIPTHDLARVYYTRDFDPCPPDPLLPLLLLPHLLSTLLPVALSATREGDIPGAALWMR